MNWGINIISHYQTSGGQAVAVPRPILTMDAGSQGADFVDLSLGFMVIVL